MVSLSKMFTEQEDPPRSPKETLPTMYDLPSEDPEEPGLPDEFHDFQPQLLSRTLRLPQYTPDNYFTASDLNLYYDVKHPLWHKRPDWFLAVNVSRLYEGIDLRRSYVVWQEGHNPYIVAEFLSPGTASEDLGRFYREEENGAEIKESDSGKQQPPRKFEVYEKKLRIPHYLVYSRYSQQLRYFKLEGGTYQEQEIQPQNPQIWLEELEVGLGIWEGVFEGISSYWLRWCDAEGNWLLTDTEQAQLEKEQVQLEKEQVQNQLFQAARNLLATGMPESQIALILGISVEEIRAL